MYACIYELWKNCCGRDGTGGKIEGSTRGPRGPKKDFLPKNNQIWPKIGIFGQFWPGYAGFFGALLVGRLEVVVRGLYLARHLFTLYLLIFFQVCLKSKNLKTSKGQKAQNLTTVALVNIDFMVVKMKNSSQPISGISSLSSYSILLRCSQTIWR